MVDLEDFHAAGGDVAVHVGLPALVGQRGSEAFPYPAPPFLWLSTRSLGRTGSSDMDATSTSARRSHGRYVQRW
jgi:hypothetical protein